MLSKIKCFFGFHESFLDNSFSMLRLIHHNKCRHCGYRWPEYMTDEKFVDGESFVDHDVNLIAHWLLRNKWLAKKETNVSDIKDEATAKE